MRTIVVVFAAAMWSQACFAQDLYERPTVEVAAPIGWQQFCVEYDECDTTPVTPVMMVLTGKAWDDLTTVNNWVNTHILPITDLEHWGVAERWNYPDDGYGDCEDYALEKRRMLMDAGWPRSALLMTVVKDQNGNGHAVLTVHTTRGDFILDNQRSDIVLWTEDGYTYTMRQSEVDPNIWVAIAKPELVTSSFEDRWQE